MQAQEQIQVTIARTETSDVKLKFLEIFEIFEACGNLIYCSCEGDWQKLHLFQQILRIDAFYVTYVARRFSPLFTLILFTGVKEIFLCLVLWPLYCNKFDRCSSFGYIYIYIYIYIYTYKTQCAPLNFLIESFPI